MQMEKEENYEENDVNFFFEQIFLLNNMRKIRLIGLKFICCPMKIVKSGKFLMTAH